MVSLFLDSCTSEYTEKLCRFGETNRPVSDLVSKQLRPRCEPLGIAVAGWSYKRPFWSLCER